MGRLRDIMIRIGAWARARQPYGGLILVAPSAVLPLVGFYLYGLMGALLGLLAVEVLFLIGNKIIGDLEE